jgi:hypothetical protein
MSLICFCFLQECGKRLVNMNLLRQHEINKHAKIELGTRQIFMY